MEQKNFKSMIAALEKVSGEQKRVTSHLLEKLETITEGLIDIIKQHDLEDVLEKFDYREFGFRLKGSQHGKWIHFCNIEYLEYDHEITKILPTQTKHIGDGFYYHGDFNYWVDYMHRGEVLTLCEILPDFIKNMTSKIQSLTDKEQKFLNQFETIEV